MNRFVRTWLAIGPAIAIQLFIRGWPSEAAAAGVCESCSQGVATSLITSAAQASYQGKSICQVFTAPDTLLTEFTFWTVPRLAPTATGMHLFITEVDSTGRPDPARVVLDGATLAPGDTSGLPTPVHFYFSPPLALPHRGTFAAAIKEEDPYCLSGFGVQVDTTESYACGALWLIHPRVDCSGLGTVAELLSGLDLVFHVQFACSDSTATVPASWGQVKARYR